MLQSALSVKNLFLQDISWLVGDVHSLISCMSSRHLECVYLMPECQLDDSPSSSSYTAVLQIKRIAIQAPISINILVSLLSKITLDKLFFALNGKVFHMSNYAFLPQQVSVAHSFTYKPNTIQNYRPKQIW